MFLICVVILQLFYGRDSSDKVGKEGKWGGGGWGSPCWY